MGTWKPHGTWNSIRNLRQSLAPIHQTCLYASCPSTQAFSSEITRAQAPPSPKHRQKPRASLSSTRNQRFKKIASDPGLLSGNRSSPGFRVWLRPERNPG
ncbi:hypothetical protein DY000_02007262 [Brassica cretica]|uniref:Uncharacterized protein n=1 Tax=Brassica cretica TaxID=69181 RepID=A0ABQ7BTL0_BRACR|nr:hypothetical protein DY000_02007262 [Brassica cretica]